MHKYIYFSNSIIQIHNQSRYFKRHILYLITKSSSYGNSALTPVSSIAQASSAKLLLIVAGKVMYFNLFNSWCLLRKCLALLVRATLLFCFCQNNHNFQLNTYYNYPKKLSNSAVPWFPIWGQGYQIMLPLYMTTYLLLSNWQTNDNHINPNLDNKKLEVTDVFSKGDKVSSSLNIGHCFRPHWNNQTLPMYQFSGPFGNTDTSRLNVTTEYLKRKPYEKNIYNLTH